MQHQSLNLADNKLLTFFPHLFSLIFLLILTYQQYYGVVEPQTILNQYGYAITNVLLISLLVPMYHTQLENQVGLKKDYSIVNGLVILQYLVACLIVFLFAAQINAQIILSYLTYVYLTLLAITYRLNSARFPITNYVLNLFLVFLSVNQKLIVEMGFIILAAQAIELFAGRVWRHFEQLMLEKHSKSIKFMTMFTVASSYFFSASGQSLQLINLIFGMVFFLIVLNIVLEYLQVVLKKY